MLKVLFHAVVVAGLLVPIPASAGDLEPPGYYLDDHRYPAPVIRKRIKHKKVIVEEPLIVRKQRIVVERPVVVERPIVIERPIIVEKRVVVERPIIVKRKVIVERPVKYDFPAYEEDDGDFIYADDGPDW